MRRKNTLLFVILFTGLVSTQNVHANVFTLFLKYWDEAFDALRAAGKYSDEVVDTLRQGARYHDEAMETLRMTGRFPKDALETIRKSGKWNEQALNALRGTGRFSEETINALRLTSRYGDDIVEIISASRRNANTTLDAARAGMRRGEVIDDAVKGGRLPSKKLKRVFIDEFGEVSDDTPEGIAAFFKTYDDMIARGAARADAERAAAIAKKQMDDLFYNGITVAD